MSRRSLTACMGIANNGRCGLALNSSHCERSRPNCFDPRAICPGFFLAPLSGNAATIIAVILFSDDNPNRALTDSAIVVRELLQPANIRVVQFERLAGAHLFEWVFLVSPDFVDHRPNSFFAIVLCKIERSKSDSFTNRGHSRQRSKAGRDKPVLPIWR